ncbi:MAG: NFACT RNA binding domain-containing protein [Candidatus Woesearchaeota archaeon]
MEKKRKREWYEKFRWFYASNGMLVIGGRDATTNEIVIKKHTQTGDLVFHTDMAGSPFFVIKADSQQIDEQVRQEVATLTIVYSRAWQMKLSSIDVFSVLPEQVSKQAQAGESLSRGSFVIRGKTTYYQVQMDFCIGVDDQFRVHVGTQDSIKKHTTAFVRIVQGDTKTSEIAKQLRTIFGGGDLDEYIRQLPTGGCKIVREPEKFAR